MDRALALEYALLPYNVRVHLQPTAREYKHGNNVTFALNFNPLPEIFFVQRGHETTDTNHPQRSLHKFSVRT